ncbi:MAG: DUF177 domain-containing protein [Oscillospiraceae bacterium]|jgi:uncharacterized protein|nr:DUF177 domain-containing protein [Oscillospiraceae bacterium]
MKLALRDVIEQPGARVPFCCEFDLSDMEFPWGRPFRVPVRARGSVTNTAGVLTLTAALAATLSLTCDRCAAAYEQKADVPVEMVLAERLAGDEDDEIYLLTGDELALDEVLIPALVLAMETKHLCREDCRGLCPRCGHNLNEGPCGCPPPEGDARWAALRQWRP